MYLAEIFIPFERSKAKPGEILDGAWSLYAAWKHNGQIYGNNPPVLSGKDGLRWFAQIPERNALAKKWNGESVRGNIEKLVKLGAGPPQVRILGRDATLPPVCRCRKPGWYYLFTTFLDIASPLVCGDCRNPVPLYRIPKSPDERHEGVLRWQVDYQACDSLWIGSVVGERYHQRQMELPDSQLSKMGREICAAIEERSGTPTYYYLSRHSGRSLKAELERKCPVCAGEWRLEEKWGLFDFRCDRCRLVSNIAFDVRRG
jgi:predicted  nucleic acid-binding Zn ribbon protein